MTYSSPLPLFSSGILSHSPKDPPYGSRSSLPGGVGVVVASPVVRVIVQILLVRSPPRTGSGRTGDPAHDEPTRRRGNGCLPALFPPLSAHFPAPLLAPFVSPLPASLTSLTTSHHDRGFGRPRSGDPIKPIRQRLVMWRERRSRGG